MTTNGWLAISIDLKRQRGVEIVGLGGEINLGDMFYFATSLRFLFDFLINAFIDCHFVTMQQFFF